MNPRLHIQPLGMSIDPAAAFEVISAGVSYAFWLDSARAGSPASRYSYLGVVPEDRGVLRIEQAQPACNPWALLEQKLADAPAVDLPRRLLGLRHELLGGYVGYFGYEARRALGVSAPRTATTPDALWMPAVRYLLIDHRTHTGYLVGDKPWIAQTADALRCARTPVRDYPRLAFPAPARSSYERAVESCLAEIYEGNSYEVCLTAETSTKLPALHGTDTSLLALYLAQREQNSAPFAALLKCSDHWVLSSSPESFLRVDSAGNARSKPIKGTVARSPEAGRDRARAEWLRTDPKTLAENLMIVDLLRNDLSRVSDPGTVRVPVLAGVETYSTVHQLVSTVESRLRPQVSAVAASAACFPGGSMTGAPKESTMNIIDRLEARPRGIYSGALGYFSVTGAASLSIVIRTLVVEGNSVRLGAGGAVVADSDPAAEYREMLTKLRAAVPGSGKP